MSAKRKPKWDVPINPAVEDAPSPTSESKVLERAAKVAPTLESDLRAGKMHSFEEAFGEDATPRTPLRDRLLEELKGCVLQREIEAAVDRALRAANPEPPQKCPKCGSERTFTLLHCHQCHA